MTIPPYCLVRGHRAGTQVVEFLHRRPGEGCAMAEWIRKRLSRRSRVESVKSA